jgi:hypothetical protein
MNRAGIDTVTCVWDIIFGFYGRSQLATTRKEWTLHRFGHLIGADVLAESRTTLKKILKFPKLLYLSVFSPAHYARSVNLTIKAANQISNYNLAKDVTLRNLNNVDLR